MASNPILVEARANFDQNCDLNVHSPTLTQLSYSLENRPLYFPHMNTKSNSRTRNRSLTTTVNVPPPYTNHLNVSTTMATLRLLVLVWMLMTLDLRVILNLLICTLNITITNTDDHRVRTLNCGFVNFVWPEMDFPRFSVNS